MTPAIHLSFAPSDREHAALLHKALRDRGARVLLDDDPLLSGDAWSDAVVSRVRRALASVVFMPATPEPGFAQVLFALGVAKAIARRTIVVVENQSPAEIARDAHLRETDFEWVRSDSASLQNLAERLTARSGADA